MVDWEAAKYAAKQAIPARSDIPDRDGIDTDQLEETADKITPGGEVGTVLSLIAFNLFNAVYSWSIGMTILVYVFAAINVYYVGLLGEHYLIDRDDEE